MKPQQQGKPPRRTTCLAFAIAASLSGSVAFAQTDRERALEERVAQLEAVVQQLLDQQQTIRSETAAVRTEQSAQAARLDSMPAAAPLPAGTAAIQASTLTPGANPGTRLTYGGFIKLDAMATNTGDGELPDGPGGARALYLPGAIPVGGTDEGSDIDMHAQFSRFWLSADTTLDSGDKLRGYLEFDLFGGALGNEAATNTYGVTIRHAYATWNNWLAGQTWSNFQDVAALPDSVDFIGPTDGTTFVRQAQLRYTTGNWSFSAENPETLLTPHGGGARISSEDNSLPDFTLRYTRKGDWGHFGIAGLFRQLKHENPATNTDDSITGYGVSASGRFVLGPKDDIRYMLTAGRGISRYIGLAITNDAALDPTGELDAIDTLAGFVAWRHAFSTKFRTNLFYARSQYDNDTTNTGLGITRQVHSVHANAIWSPLPKLDLGVELMYGVRELENGADGDLTRLHFHAKYSF